jgi:hypothetical protein
MTKQEGIRSPVSSLEGKLALTQVVKQINENQIIDKSSLKIAVKYSLQLLHHKIPGKSVELRIPPFAAVSIIQGKNHKRGTPPATIEIDPITWLNIFTNQISWQDAQNMGLIQASGPDADLSPFLPIDKVMRDEKI